VGGVTFLRLGEREQRRLMGLTAKDSPETLMIYLDSGEPMGPFGAESAGKGAIDGGGHQRARAGRRQSGT